MAVVYAPSPGYAGDFPRHRGEEFSYLVLRRLARRLLILRASAGGT